MTTVPKRVRLSQEQRVSDILAAARQVIGERGYENVLMSEVAERAGVVEGTIYRYFESKRELLLRVADDWFAEVLDNDPELPRLLGTWNKLRHLIWRALMTIRRQPALSRFVLLEVRQQPNYRATRSYQLNRRLTSQITELCEQAQQSGEFRKDVSVMLLRNLIFGCIEHQTWRFLRGEGDFAVDEVADGIATVVYRGMLAETAPATTSGLDSIVRRLEAIADRLGGPEEAT